MTKPKVDLMAIFEEAERGDPDAVSIDRNEIIKAPFGWPGGKSKALDKILPHLPYYNSYVEVFGGSGAVLLARDESKLEVYNDRFGGVTDFYTTLRDPQLYTKLMERLDLCLHSREEFMLCRDTWKDTLDPVERAARWYYSIQFSFASKGKSFGRSVKGTNCTSGKVAGGLPDFPKVHRRLRNVMIENQDFRTLMKDFDSPETVFYLDPPYMDTHQTAYKHEMTMQDHKDLLDCIFSCKGFVALSGYPNDLYHNNPWDKVEVWDQYVSIKGAVHNEQNNLAHLKDVDERGTNRECLWIKEAQ